MGVLPKTLAAHEDRFTQWIDNDYPTRTDAMALAATEFMPTALHILEWTHD